MANNNEIKVVLVGLDCSGKTSFLYKLKFNENVSTIPTQGIQNEIIKYNNQQYNILEVGGLEKMRFLWRHHIIHKHILAFFIDSGDAKRLEEAKNEFDKVITNPDLEQQTSILVVATKQDLPDAQSTEEIREKLELDKITNFKWKIIGLNLYSEDSQKQLWDAIIESQ